MLVLVLILQHSLIYDQLTQSCLPLILKKDKYKEVPPTAIDLFRDLHCSSKTGLSEPVKEAIVSLFKTKLTSQLLLSRVP